MSFIIDYLKHKLPQSLVYSLLSYSPWVDAVRMPFIQKGYFLKGEFVSQKIRIHGHVYHVEYFDCIDVYDFGWSEDGYEIDDFGQMVVPPTYLRVSSDKRMCLTSDGVYRPLLDNNKS